MKSLNVLAAVLLIVGSLNWGLVAIADFDLVGWIFGEEFGTTNAASRVVYALVGVAALYGTAALLGASRSAAHPARPASAPGDAAATDRAHPSLLELENP
jgi:uncharacterized membrane protein YuzA (DUF378 family)